MRPQASTAMAWALCLALAGCGATNNSNLGDGSVPSGTQPDPPQTDIACTPADHARWAPIELDLAGPSASETDISPNPFTDFRLTVAFTGPRGQTYAVPGFFDGDGQGGATGAVWRARFNADEAGLWTWTAALVSGSGIALDPTASGTPTAFSGQTGSFCVGPVAPNATGFLAHGRLQYADDHYFKLSDGTFWIKGGADSPENFLGYAGFDNTFDQPGGTNTAGLTNGLHRYEPHIADWRPGDPDWNGGDGQGIIGALNYLGNQEVNSIYFLPCNLQGDGRDTYPYVDPNDLRHLDVSKLQQWNMVFSHAQRRGIALHFVLHETENGNENLHDGGTLGPDRRLYYRELVARFAHHPALFWNIGEENDYGPTRQKEFAAYIRQVDPYHHPITVHTHVNRPADQYAALVGDPLFDLTSIQLSPARAGEFTEAWRQQSAAAGRPWVVMLDEIGPAGTGVTDTNAGDIRKLTLWPALLSGAGGVEWYFGYHDLPLGGDVRTEDFRTREDMWRYTRIARRFVEDNLPFTEMEPRDDLLTGATGEVFAKVAAVYAVYLPNANASASLNLSGISGDFELRYFDPRAGRFVGGSQAVTAGGTVPLGTPPNAPNDDWVILVTGTGTGTGPDPDPTPPEVTGFTLINADTNTAIMPLTNGTTLTLSDLPTRNLNVRADVSSATQSVRFGYNGNANYRTESAAPFALAGDTNGDYAPWTPPVGAHTITATPYTASAASGVAGSQVQVTLTVR